MKKLFWFVLVLEMFFLSVFANCDQGMVPLEIKNVDTSTTLTLQFNAPIGATMHAYSYGDLSKGAFSTGDEEKDNKIKQQIKSSVQYGGGYSINPGGGVCLCIKVSKNPAEGSSENDFLDIHVIGAAKFFIAIGTGKRETVVHDAHKIRIPYSELREILQQNLSQEEGEPPTVYREELQARDFLNIYKHVNPRQMVQPVPRSAENNGGGCVVS